MPKKKSQSKKRGRPKKKPEAQQKKIYLTQYRKSIINYTCPKCGRRAMEKEIIHAAVFRVPNLHCAYCGSEMEKELDLFYQ